jgi:DNA-binding transcriptional LysR family regulator
MELRQIRYFIAVAEHLSYSKAAQELHISVSPLSRQICQLEDEFGVRLFVRDRRRVQLTDAGTLFLQDAKDLLSQTQRVSDHLRQARNGAAGAVRIGVALHLGDRVGSVVADHAKRYPAVEIECRCICSTLQNAALRDGQIDIGFLRPPVDTVLASEVLYDERLIAIVSKANALARRRSVRVKDLAAETLFLPERSVGSGLRDRILELYSKAGVNPRTGPVPVDPSSPSEVHKILLAANKGIFIIADELAARADNSAAAVAVPIDDPDAKIAVHLAWRRNETSPAVLALLDTACKVLAASPAPRALHGALARIDASPPSAAPHA